MTKTNSLYFKNGNKFIKTANIDSPDFVGTPNIPEPINRLESKRIATVEFVKTYINAKINKLDYHTKTSTTNEIILHPNKEYLIHVEGIINRDESLNQINFGSIALCDEQDTLLKKMDSNEVVSDNTGGILQSGTMVIRTPISGIIKAYTDYDSTKTPAKYICAVEIDRDDYCIITLNDTDHQKMYFYTNDETYIEPEFMISKNSVYTIKIIPDIGYKQGTVTPSTSGIVEGDTVFDITPAIYDPCYITINQTPNQTIYVSNEGITHSDSFIGRYGTDFDVTVVADAHYTAGTPSIDHGVIDDNITITASQAKQIYHKITVKQWAHQTITLTRLDTGETTTRMFNLPEHTKILVEVVCKPDYIPGELNVDTTFYADEDMVVTTTKPKYIYDD